MDATLYDGHTARAFAVVVEPDGNGIRLLLDGETVGQIARTDLVALDGTGATLRFGHRSVEGWRLITPAPLPAALASGFPAKVRFDPALRRGPMAVAVAVTAVVTLALGALIAAPYSLAAHVPMAWEKKIGAAYDLPAGFVACDDGGAQQALEKIVDRLDPEARRDGVRVALLDVDEINAAALPGQKIIVLNGLFDVVRDSDALAGILAHELSHVRRRHVAAGMIRQMGIGTIVTLAGGGTFAGSGGNLLSLSYTREAEAEADADAIAMLHAARIDPRATARAFDRLRALDSGLPDWTKSHPPSADRATRFASSYDARMSYRPSLPRAETGELLEACRG